MDLEINHTIVFSKNLKAYEKGYRFIVNQGGARSSKTYSIIQMLIFICLTEKNTKVSVVRKSFPSLRGSVLKDFIEIMENLKIYDLNRHNRTEQSYRFFNGSTLEFFSIDDAQKVRGRKRDICYCNEANELTFEDFQQLSLRTSKTVIVDFNPSDTEHFLYDLISDERSILIKSTYKDNSFLSQDIINEIENLINVDENYYKIYALGERPIAQSRIYSHFKQFSGKMEYDDWCWGMDFGFNHPTALVKVGTIDGRVYVEEHLYKTGLTIEDLVQKVKAIVNDGKDLYCDSARPDIIESLRRVGLRAKASDKAVKEGINEVKSREIYLDINSENMWKEYRLYSWRVYKEQILDEPVKDHDHALDALRYALYSTRKGQFDKKYIGIYSPKRP
jgi:phage terminase large subunit